MLDVVQLHADQSRHRPMDCLCGPSRPKTIGLAETGPAIDQRHLLNVGDTDDHRPCLPALHHGDPKRDGAEDPVRPARNSAR